MICDSKVGFAASAFASLRVLAGIVCKIEIALDTLQRGQLRQVCHRHTPQLDTVRIKRGR